MYLVVTNKERQIYNHSKHLDREVLDVENTMYGSTYYVGKKLYGKEPERNFLTWKEFRKEHNF